MIKANTKTKVKSSISLPSVKDMLEAGVHFGHETKRWNPNYSKYIFKKRDKFHIIDLEKTLGNFEKALDFISKKAETGNILIVGTKRQARDIVKEESIRCGVHYVVNRWVGGLMTNFSIINKSIKKLHLIESKLDGDLKGLSQQQLSVLRREWARFDRIFNGVKYLEKIPDVMIIIDPKFERIALKEARTVKMPVVAIVDSNTDPKLIDYPIPANDDAIKSIQLFMRYIADTILKANKGKGVKYVLRDYSYVGIKKEDQKKVSGKK
jgi:small subunit ribosomal protein S2